MVNNKRVTIIDDDPLIRQTIQRGLQRAGATVLECETAAALLEQIKLDATDLLLLDLRLPDSDGMSVLAEVRRQTDVPVIIVTGQGDEYDEVTGLELGADDFIRKPFTFKVLLARIRNVLRRSEFRPPRNPAPELADFLSERGWSIDGETRQLVSSDGVLVPLSSTELRILQALAERPDIVIDRESLYVAVFNRKLPPQSRTVDVLISRLRKKLTDASGEAQTLQIHTAHGRGYMLS